MTAHSVWLTGAASIRGVGHVKQDLPNQDSFRILSSPDGDIVAAVVADGAGSAPRAAEGSAACAGIICQRLLEIGVAVAQGSLSSAAVRDRLLMAIIEVRAALDPSGNSLSHFHTTLTGVVATPSGGIIVQIGDSPAIVACAGQALGPDGTPGVDFFHTHRICTADSGEYSNETFFLTQASWQSHLKIMPLEPGFGAVLLMSDGAGELALYRGQPYRPFIGTLMASFLAARDEEERAAAIAAALAAPGADSLTADDKTLLMICPTDWLRYAGQPHVTKPEQEPEQAPEQEPEHESGQEPSSPKRTTTTPQPTEQPAPRPRPQRSVAPPRPHSRPASAQRPENAPARSRLIVPAGLLALLLTAALGIAAYKLQGDKPAQDPVQNATLPAPAQNATAPVPAQNATLPAPAQNATLPATAQNATLPATAPAAKTAPPAQVLPRVQRSPQHKG